MKRVLVIAALIVLASASQAMACKLCHYEFVWPQLDECAFCDDTWCGYVLCHIEQGDDPNDGDHCEYDGSDCNDKGDGWCPPPSYSRLDENWKLTRVQVARTIQRGATVRSGKKG